MSFWVVCYDISDDRRRQKVSRILEGYGRRAQYSVFECDLEEGQRARLETMLKRVLRDDEDDIRFYPLNRADLKRVRLLGRAELHRARGWHMV